MEATQPQDIILLTRKARPRFLIRRVLINVLVVTSDGISHKEHHPALARYP
ncbi:hypothetical protein AVEN_231771-1, partial [Araneus ventricosus]